MFCTNCGEKLQENTVFCPKCGAPAPKTQAVVQPNEEPETLYVEQPTEEPKKKNGCLIAGLIVGGIGLVLGILTLVIIVIVVVAGVLFTRKTIEKPMHNHTEIIEEYDEEDDYEYSDDYEYDEEHDYKNTLESYGNQDYILPQSDSRYLTESDLNGLTEAECRIARNEIYARHGRMFNDEELQAYFNSKSWYTPLIPANAFQEHMLNDYEKKNKDVILEYERARGWN